MADWIKISTDAGVGLGAGALGEYVASKDTATAKWYKQPSTYYKYGFPIVAILLSAFGIIRGDWETRLITAGATMAGGKAYHQIKGPAGYHSRWTKEDELRRSRAEAERRAREARERGGGGGGPREVTAEI